MGALGESIRSTIRGLIDNPSFKSTITLTAITRTKGGLGGYEAVTETETSSTTVNCIPTEFAKDKVQLLKFGDLKTGELSLLLRDDQTLDTDDQITFEGANYNIRQVIPVPFNEVTVANELILSEKL